MELTPEQIELAKKIAPKVTRVIHDYFKESLSWANVFEGSWDELMKIPGVVAPPYEEGTDSQAVFEDMHELFTQGILAGIRGALNYEWRKS